MDQYGLTELVNGRYGGHLYFVTAENLEDAWQILANNYLANTTVDEAKSQYSLRCKNLSPAQLQAIPPGQKTLVNKPEDPGDKDK